MTAPHIGNTGVNGEDDESSRMWVAGFVVRDPARRPSNWRATGSLDDELAAQGVVGISGIDTRALTRHLRERGAMRVGISSEIADPDELLARVHGRREHDRRRPRARGEHRRGLRRPGGGGEAVHDRRARPRHQDGDPAAPGRARRRDPRAAVDRPPPRSCSPPDRTASSSPTARATRRPPTTRSRRCKGVLDARRPLFGICFGNQILGRALGLGTYKLRFGHRGLNQPVLDRVSNTVRVTSHNHGFAVDAPLDRPTDTPYGRVEVSHVGLNDDVVEGLRCLDVPAFSVQFHPESAAGPHDAAPLFQRFVDLMEEPARMPKRTDI